MTRRWLHAALAASLIILGCDSRSESEATPGARLYVTSGLTDQVLMLDAADGEVLDAISLERRRDEIDEPHGIALAPDGRHWYATVSHGEPTLWKFELPDNRLVGRTELGTYGAARIGITPDGRRGFIPDYYRSGGGAESGLAVVQLEDLSIAARPNLCAAPHDAQVSRAGDLVAIACSLSDEVVIIDAATLEIVSHFFVDDEPGAPGDPRFKPLNLVWSPGGDALYVTTHVANQLRVFDLDGSLLGAVEVGAGPAQLALTRDGRTLVTANRNDASASLVELPTLEERARVQLNRPHPHGVALDDSDRFAFISYEGTTQTMGGVVALDVESGRVLWAREAGFYTLGVIYVPGE